MQCVSIQQNPPTPLGTRGQGFLLSTTRCARGGFEAHAGESYKRFRRPEAQRTMYNVQCSGFQSIHAIDGTDHCQRVKQVLSTLLVRTLRSSRVASR